MDPRARDRPGPTHTHAAKRRARPPGDAPVSVVSRTFWPVDRRENALWKYCLPLILATEPLEAALRILRSGGGLSYLQGPSLARSLLRRGRGRWI